MRPADPIQRFNYNDDNEEDDESEYENNPLYNRIYNLAENFAATNFGQYVTRKLDRILQIIEDTAKWSLPPIRRNRRDSLDDLRRPLSWIPFLLLLTLLRVIRSCISLVVVLIGETPLVANDVVYFIQTRRRKLRAVRTAGMKRIREKRNKAREYTAKRGLLSILTSIMSTALCRPKLYEESGSILISDETLEGAQCPGPTQAPSNNNDNRVRRSEYSNVSDEDLNLCEMLEKYGGSGNEDDDDDPDFIPPIDPLQSSDSSDTSTASYEFDSNDEEHIEKDNIEPEPSISNPNEESNVLANGNISVESNDISMDTKQNGEQLDKKRRKHKTMPKPIKDEPVPLPIQEIKQEPVDSDEESNRNIQEPQKLEDPQQFNNINQHQEQQPSIVEPKTDYKRLNSTEVAHNGEDQQMDVLNGDQKLSQSGSPELSGAFGYQPISILKNRQAVHLEQRGHVEDFAANEEFIKGESTYESAATSRPPNRTNYTGRPIKNKYRGKRR